MEVVRNLIYADNTTVIVGTKLIESMERVRKTCKETSLCRNVLNTKVKTTGDMEDVTVDGEMVDVVIIFISLGTLIIRDGLCDKEIRRGNAMGKDYSFSSRFHLALGCIGRCGRHNSPQASSVIDLVLCRSDGPHVSVDTVHPYMFRSSSLSSPGCYHLQSLSSCVVLVSSPTCVAKPYILYLNSITCGSLADCILTLINGIPFRHMYSAFALDTFIPLVSKASLHCTQFQLHHVVLPCVQHHIICEHHLPMCIFRSVNPS